MPDKRLHIISFDNPFPPVYGGVIDVFFKVKALHQLGFEIYLHCLDSDEKTPAPELASITEKVFFYPSVSNPLYFFSGIPYSVISRNDKRLLQNITAVKAPILFEGLKTTYFADHEKLKDYFKVLRLHNIEQDYFLGISRSEKSIFRKILYHIESIKYHSYEKIITKFDKVATLSRYEDQYIKEKFKNSVYIPVFHGNDKVLELDGMGEYALYHGDLKTSDNRAAVAFLIEVFKEIPDYKLLIAANIDKGFCEKLIGGSDNIEYIRIQDFGHLLKLLKSAHICISWSFQKSGTKLKVVNALFNSRFSIINENVVDDKIVADLCEIASDKKQLIEKINALRLTSFADFNMRKSVLEVYLNDVRNAELIANLML